MRGGTRRSGTADGVKAHIDALSTVSIKGCNLQSHAQYLVVFLAHSEELWHEYTRPRWARQRLRLYGGKKRVFARFFNHVQKSLEAVTPGCKITIAYGSAKFAPGGRNEASVPTSRAYKECASRFNTLVISEFRSSKVYYYDNNVLQLISVRLPGPFRSLRGSLWSVEQTEFVSRDLNAALNIRRNLLEHPDILNPSLAVAKLEQRVAKRINPR